MKFTIVSVVMLTSTTVLQTGDDSMVRGYSKYPSLLYILFFYYLQS